MFLEIVCSLLNRMTEIYLVIRPLYVALGCLQLKNSVENCELGDNRTTIKITRYYRVDTFLYAVYAVKMLQ